jgi:hypothetical protein
MSLLHVSEGVLLSHLLLDFVVLGNLLLPLLFLHISVSVLVEPVILIEVCLWRFVRHVRLSVVPSSSSGLVIIIFFMPSYQLIDLMDIRLSNLVI